MVGKNSPIVTISLETMLVLLVVEGADTVSASFSGSFSVFGSSAFSSGGSTSSETFSVLTVDSSTLISSSTYGNNWLGYVVVVV